MKFFARLEKLFGEGLAIPLAISWIAFVIIVFACQFVIIVFACQGAP